MAGDEIHLQEEKRSFTLASIYQYRLKKFMLQKVGGFYTLDGYMGMDVHRATRVGHVGHGGQVLLSETTTSLVQDELPEGVAGLELGRRRLKDMQRPSQPHAGGYGPCNDPAAPVDREGPGDQPPIVSLSTWQRISLLRSLE